MIRRMGRQINRFRVPVAVVVAASMAMAVWAPASAAGTPGYKAPAPLLGAPHVTPSIPGSHGLLLHPQTIQRDTSASYSLYSGLANVKTTSGQTRTQFVDFNKPSTGAVSADVVLVRHNSSFSQSASNDWYFQNLPASDLSASGGNATVTLKSTQIGPFGSLTGKFTHTSSKAEKCTSGSETDYFGTFALTEHFYTKNAKESNSTLGAVYGPSGTGGTINYPNTSTNRSELQVNNGCIPYFPPPGKTYCVLGTDWFSPSASKPDRSFGGFKETVETPTPSSYHEVYGARDVNIGGLPSTGGYGSTAVKLTRYDSVYDGTFSNQSYSQTTTSSTSPLKEVATAPSGDTYMKGSATLRSASSSYTAKGYSCYSGSTAKTEHFRSSNAPYSWTNGSTPLTAVSAVGGNITIGNLTGSSSGNIYHYSYS